MRPSGPSVIAVELVATVFAVLLFLVGVASADAVRREWPALGAWLASRLEAP